MSFAPYRLAELGDRISFRITSPVSFECGQFMGLIVEHHGDNEFTVERNDEYHIPLCCKAVEPLSIRRRARTDLMTKAQRSAKAKRAGAKRRKANAAAAFLRRMNPGKKLPAAVRVKRLKGGGISVTPIEINAGPWSIRKTKKRLRLFTSPGGNLETFKAKIKARKAARRSR